MRADRRMVNDVTVIATQKLDENLLQIGKQGGGKLFPVGCLIHLDIINACFGAS